VLEGARRLDLAWTEVFKARLVERGMSEVMAQANLDMWVAKSQGLDHADPPTLQLRYDGSSV